MVFANMPSQSDSMSALAAGLSGRDPGATAQFYELFGRGFKFLLFRHLGAQDLDDHVQTCILHVMQAITKGDGIREPERLPGFVHTIVRRYIAREIARRARERATREFPENMEQFPVHGKTTEDLLGERQTLENARNVLAGMSLRDRSVLVMFYVEGQAPDKICREMGLTPVQFRNLKQRAKQRFISTCRSTISSQRRPVCSQPPVRRLKLA